MKICVPGATGNSGRRIVKQAAERGMSVTAIVRSADRAQKLAHANVSIVEADFGSIDSLASVMEGHDAVLNAAGYLSDAENFKALVRRVISAAEVALGPEGRFWTFAGAALLDVPGTSIMTVDLPGVPKIFREHLSNYARLRESKLDWSLLCPGPMIPAPDGLPTADLLVSTDTWPIPRPSYARFLPRIATSLAFRSALGRFTIYYEDAAKVMLDNLACDGPFKCKRVGVALPAGVKRFKEVSTQPAPADADRRA